MEGEMVLEVGKKESLKFSLFSSLNMIYAGMPNDRTFSIALIEGMGNYRYSTNLFFEKNKSTIKLAGKEFRVIGVNTERITLLPVKH